MVEMQICICRYELFVQITFFPHENPGTKDVKMRSNIPEDVA